MILCLYQIFSNKFSQKREKMGEGGGERNEGKPTSDRPYTRRTSLIKLDYSFSFSPIPIGQRANNY